MKEVQEEEAAMEKTSLQKVNFRQEAQKKRKEVL